MLQITAWSSFGRDVTFALKEAWEGGQILGLKAQGVGVGGELG